MSAFFKKLSLSLGIAVVSLSLLGFTTIIQSPAFHNNSQTHEHCEVHHAAHSEHASEESHHHSESEESCVVCDVLSHAAVNTTFTHFLIEDPQSLSGALETHLTDLTLSPFYGSYSGRAPPVAF